LKVCDACSRRSISRVSAGTPLLVPSFSSRGFPDIAGIHELMRDNLYETSLVSAYDLHHGCLSAPEIYATEILLVDSGGYEARAAADPAEPYIDLRPGRNWEVAHYAGVLDGLEPLSRLVVVSFDHAAHGPLGEQARGARSLFDRYPLFAGDFLCKPESADAPFIDVESVIACTDELATFDVLGVTEKELGDSVLKRCRNLLRIRAALHRRGHDTPIHVFGCLDPVGILAYFLCGADIFDGLAWLRFAFAGGVPIYHVTRTVLNGQWAEPDRDVIAAHRAQNLAWLRGQSRAMRRYARRHDLEELAGLAAWRPGLLDLVRTAGLKI